MKHFKHFLTILLLLCSTAASAHDFEVDGIFYNITDATAKTVEVTCKGDSYSEYNEYSGSVIIPSTVSYNSTVYDVTSIGDHAFVDCDGLTSVTIPNSVTSIGGHAFFYCYGLASIVVDDGNSVYDSREGCNAIIETATNTLIAGCKNTIIPGSVTSIGDYAFYLCTGLTSVEIPSSVTSIGNYAFSDCSGLTSIEIPNSVTSIGISAFNRCSGLTSITVNSGNSVYDSREGCNAIIETATNTLIAGCKNTIIPGSVTSIGDYAFYLCTGLTSVEIPSSVTSIGNHAFSYCSGLTSIEIPNSVTSIGEYAFFGCTGLTSIVIPNSVTSIEDGAFHGCRGLTSVTIGNSVTSIGWGAFNGCTGLTSIEIPNSVTSIGDNAFNSCSGLTSVTIPNSVTSIGDLAFYCCSGLTSIIIPNSVTSIGDEAFRYCYGLKTVYNFSSLNIVKGSTNNGYVAYYADEVINAPNGSIEGDYIFDVIDGVNTLCEYIGNGGDIVLPEDCNGENYTIGVDAFRGNTAITSVTIPNNVTSIGTSAFYRCSGLTSVTIPNSVTSIGANAFSNCTGLTDVYCLATAVPSAKSDAFNGMLLANVTLHVPAEARVSYRSTAPWNSFGTIKTIPVTEINGINYILKTATKTATVIARSEKYSGNITIPDNIVYDNATFSVTTIQDNAFDGCGGLTSVTIPNSVTSIGNWAFSQCRGLTSIEIPNSVTSIGNSALRGCTGLTSVTIPNSVTLIGYSAFSGCTGITSVTIPNSVTSIGSSAFSYCSGLTSIVVDANNSVYDSREGCNAIIETATNTLVAGCKNTIIPNSVTSIGDYAFDGCGGLKSIEIPNSVTTIGSNAFCDCIGLTSVTIPNSVTSIGDWAFYYCTGLTSVEIGNSVTSIGDWAFYYCYRLKSIEIPNSVTTIGNFAFCDCTGITSFEIPSSVTSIGNEAFRGCTGITSIIVIRGNSVYDSREGCNAIIETATNTLVAGCQNTIIPGSVTSIGNGAFGGCTGLTSIEIPNSVTSIGNSTFVGCTGLTSIVIPNSVTSIGNGAFGSCTGLTSVTIPNSVTSIGMEAFFGCTGLTSIEIPNSVTSIGDYAFYNCRGLTSIEIPNSVTTIGGCAFFGCTGLTSIEIPNSVTSIGYNAFYACTGLKTVANNSSLNIVKGSTTNGYVAYYADKVINAPNGSTEGDYVFGVIDGVNTLCGYVGNSSTITLPENYKSENYVIGSNAFRDCTGLKSIEIPNSVTSIESNAFYGCTGLKTVYNFSSLKLIKGSTGNGYVAYYADKVINVPNGSIEGDYVFAVINGVNTLYAYIGNDSIISLPANYKGGSYMIGDNAFNGNTVITGVTIPESVTAIGADAFKGCTALKDIYAQGSIPALLDSEAFAEHYASATLHVPAGTKAAYQSSVSQREEMEIRRLPVYNNDLLASMSGFDKDAQYETVKVETQNPDVAGTLNGNDYLLAYQPLKTKMTDLPKATFETSIARNGRYKIALVTVPWFIESYSDTLISSSIDPQYADSYLRVRVNQNKEQLAMFPCDSFNIGTSKTNFGVWEKHAIVPDRSRIDTIFLKDANNEDYIFDFVNNHSVDVNIELLRPLEYNERNGRYVAKNANNFAFRFLLDQIMLIPVEGDAKLTTTHWKNFANIVEEANDLVGDVDGDGVIDVADATTLVSMILDNSLATDAADVDGDGTVDVADVTSLVSIILGTRTANDAPAKAAATRAGEISTVSADGDGETLLINIDNPGYPFSAIQFDLELPEGIEVDFDGEYYAVDLGSRTNSRKHSYPECAIQPDGSLRVVIISMSNALYNGTEGDVATATLKVNGATDGDYRFTIKNVVLSAPGSKEKLAPYTGWINVTGGVTGISEIKEERAESNDIYDLQGRKVSNPVKGGIYIQNGKKVVVNE